MEKNYVENNIYNIGDKVRIVNYGHLNYTAKNKYQEMSDYFAKIDYKRDTKMWFNKDVTDEELEKITGKAKPDNIISEDKNWWACDINPSLVGKEDIIDNVSNVQNIPHYSLSKIGAWYFESQLELVNKNINNGTK